MRHQLPCDACARAGKVMVSMYRCPRCMRTSCSLKCVQAHKSHYSCDGTRDRTAPVPKRDYTEAHFMSDYTLLEDARRAVDAANAARPRNYRDYRTPKKPVYPDAIPRRRIEMLAREAAKRGIDLRFMPSMFLRHRRNCSNVRPVVLKEDGTGEDRPFERVMLWSMEVVFWGRDGATKVVKISDVDEDTPMKDVLEGAIGSLKIKKDLLSGKEDPYIDFADAPAETITAFLKNEISLIKRLADAPIQLPDVYLKKVKRRKMADGVHIETYDMDHDTKKFNQVETGSSVRESLYGRSIVEYPIVHAVIKGSKEEKQMTDQLRDLFEKPEPEASDDSCSEEEREDEPEDGEVKEGDGNDTPMPDTSHEGDKIKSGGKAPKDDCGDSYNTDIKGNTATKTEERDKDQEEKTEIETKKDMCKEDEGTNLQEPAATDTQTVGIIEANKPGSVGELVANYNATPDERTSQELETTANGSSSSAQDIEVLPRGHFDENNDKDIISPSRIISSRPPRGGKEPIVRANYSDSEYDDEESAGGSESEAESRKGGPSAIAEKKPVSSEILSRTGKRKSRFSDLLPNNREGEERVAHNYDDPVAKRQKPISVDSGVNDRADRADCADGEWKKTGGKVTPGRDRKNSEKSPPLPFAFEYDPALLSDRIPRRKKLTGSGSLPTLKSC